MSLPLQILLSSAILLLLVTLFWRLFSRRASLPCPSWLGWMVELDNPLARDHNARTIVRRLDLKPGMKVLDAGCGPGRVTIPLAQAVGVQGEVVALDVQARMLDRAREKARMAGATNVRFQELAIEEGRLGNTAYDRIVLVTVLGEIPDREGALRELSRVLKPGGILSVTEIVFDPHYQSRESVLQSASSSGLGEKAFFGNRFAFTLHLEKPEQAEAG